MPLLLLAALFLAGGDVSANASSGLFTPVQLLCAQSGLWLLFLIPWALLHRQEAAGTNRRWLLIQAFANLGFFYLNATALTNLPVTWATSILSGATPFCVLAVVYVLFRILPPLKEVLWMLVVAAGVALVLHDQTTPGPLHPQPLGLAAAAGASFMLALTFVAVGRLTHESVNTINLWYAAVAFTVCLPLSLHPVPQPTPWPILYGVLGFFGEVTIILANNRVGPAAASLVAALVPGMAAILAWGLYRNPPDFLEALGIAIVVAGCIRVARLEATRPQPFDMPLA